MKITLSEFYVKDEGNFLVFHMKFSRSLDIPINLFKQTFWYLVNQFDYDHIYDEIKGCQEML